MHAPGAGLSTQLSAWRSERTKRMEIKEIMSRPAVTCRPEDTLNTAAQRMWEHDCGVLPVIDDDDSLVGMITDRDICMAAYSRGEALAAIRVSDAMATQAFSCHAEDSVQAAERLMADKQIRRIPIVERDNQPIGVLSLNDIARHHATEQKAALDRELVSTLAAICQPRPQQQGQQAHQTQPQMQH